MVSNPEFLREGTSVHDYLNPPLTLIGTDCEYAEQKFRELYKDINAEFVCTDIKVAEMMKYVNNTYHALKIVSVMKWAISARDWILIAIR